MTDQIRVNLPVPGTQMTTKDFLALPETMTRVELVHGVVVYPFGYPTESDDSMSPSPGMAHQDAVANIYDVLNGLKRGKVRFAPIDVTLPDGSNVQPDIFLILEGSTRAVIAKTVTGVPDLLVEVLSPSTKQYDRTVKFQLYQAAGVPEYWLADPAVQVIEIWQLMDGVYHESGAYKAGERFESPLLNVAINVDRLFAD